MSFATASGGALASMARVLLAPFGRKRAKAMAALSEAAAPVVSAQTPWGDLRFRCATSEATRIPLRLMNWEPDTVAWLEDVRPDECLWDIGAHIGVFSLMAALRMSDAGAVLSFEPSADNYAALNENIRLSGLGDKILAYPLAMTDKSGAGIFHLSGVGAAKDSHAFGEAQNAKGAFVATHRQALLGFSVDDLVEQFGLRAPDHIKLDVDSIEDKILAGAVRTLPRVKSILVEIEAERSPEWRERVVSMLAAAGLKPRESETRNKIFVRS